MTIDSHLHFWRYTPAEFPWIDDSMAALRRNFLPDAFAETMKSAAVDSVIAVQARPTLEETKWLLELADNNEFIDAVVGWLPLTSDLIGVDLESFVKFPKLRSVRHALKDETDDEFMLRDDFNRGIAHLKNFSLRYDLLISERQLPQALRFVDLHPSQIFVVNHVALPKIKDAELEPWARHIKQLALRRNVYCKVCGMVTQADWHAWTSRSLRPYFDIALEAFGPRRLMAASDWPNSLLACGYTRWFEILKEWASALSESEQQWLFSATAMEAYGLT